MEHNLLAIYLNDHLAGATGGLELARRAAAANPEGELGAFLDELAREVAEDRDALRSLMSRLGVNEDHVKVVAGWTAEKLGRLKLNGHLLSYSPLSRLVELEALALGVTGKLAMWRALERVSRADPRIAEYVDLPALIARAEKQRDGLETFRLDAAEDALVAHA